jgi:hypothetical protein
LLIVRSALVKPVTAWLKVMVTSEVLPMCCAVLLTTMVAVGAGRKRCSPCRRYR